MVTQLISGAKSVWHSCTILAASLFCLEFFSMDEWQFCILILTLIQLLVFRHRQLIFRRHIWLLMMRICSDTRFWMLVFFFLNRTLFINGQHQPRRVWVIDRPQYWFEIHYADLFLRSYWKQNFRVSARTFEYICRLVAASIQEHGTNMRETISVVKRVAVSLWRLATGDSYQSTALTFRTGKSTAVTINNEFCDAICSDQMS